VSQSARPIPPNLLFVIVDQWRASSMGWCSADPVRTPHLDAFAGQARVLTGAVSNYPVCSPCRAMLLSGAYPHRNGVPFNVNSETAAHGVGLSRETTCWSDVLAGRDYWLGYIGKWHLTPPVAADEICGEGRRADGKVWDAWTPPEQRHGFDFWYSHGCNDHHLEPHYWSTGVSREAPHRVQQWSPEHETDVALDFLAQAEQRRAAGQPFALMISYNPPHQPFDQVPQRYLDLYAEEDPAQLLTRPNVDLQSPAGREALSVAPSYFAAVTGVDEQIGRLLAELDRRDLAQDTVVVITSDHGMQLGSHDLMYKDIWYEESMRVPLLIRWPAQLSPGVDEVAVSSVDLAPTLLSLLGQEIPGSMQGQDLSAVLSDGPDGQRPDEALYLRPARGPEDADVRGLHTARHKLVVEYRNDAPPATHLYDLEDDPFELTDLAADSEELVVELSRQLCAALIRIGDPWPGLMERSIA
jgi:arylsulfatase A-like enzyme